MSFGTGTIENAPLVREVRVDRGVRRENLSSDVLMSALKQFDSSASSKTPGYSIVSTKPGGLESLLYDSKAYCKIRISRVAMHLTGDWREKFFRQLDLLMDVENWEDELPVIENTSFDTLLRMLTVGLIKKRPGLGVNPKGQIIAAWTSGDRRLTIECFPNDIVRWVVSVRENGVSETAAGKVHLNRLGAVLAPYSPELWFEAA